MKKKAEELAYEKGHEKEFELYRKVEELSLQAFEDVKKNGKDMCANVDFYSGFVYSMLNIPKELYTPIFAISRMLVGVLTELRKWLLERRLFVLHIKM